MKRQNNTRLIGGLCALCVLCLASLTVPAQRKPRAKTPIKAPTLAWATEPLDLDADSLPPFYVGHAVVEFLPALEKYQKRAAKSEFETTAQYQFRLANLRNGRLTGNLLIASNMALSIGQSEDSPLSSSYNADEGELTVRLALASRYEWLDRSRALGAYMGRTAFNRRAKVTIERRDSIYLDWDAGKFDFLPGWESSNAVYGAYARVYRVPPESARAVKAGWRALIIYEIAESDPYEYDLLEDDPTLDSPYQVYQHLYTIHVRPVDVWFFDWPTGRIYEKLNAPPEMPEVAVAAPTPSPTPLPTPEVTPPPAPTLCRTPSKAPSRPNERPGRACWPASHSS